LKTLWLAGAGVSILEILIGNSMVFYGVSNILIGIHAIIAAVLLIIIIYGLARAKDSIKRRMLVGNLALLILTAVLGIVYLQYFNIPLLIVHLLLALGLLSNFSVMYGLETSTRQ